MSVRGNAELEANQLLRGAWADEPFPVDPVQIAKSIGVEVVVAELDKDVHGALIQDETGDPTIVLNQRDNPSRRRFTCAHELGHYVRRGAARESYRYVDFRNKSSATGRDPEERFANAFAAALLMPSAAVISAVKDEGLGALELSSRFGVSVVAMEYRIENLGLLS